MLTRTAALFFALITTSLPVFAEKVVRVVLEEGTDMVLGGAENGVLTMSLVGDGVAIYGVPQRQIPFTIQALGADQEVSCYWAGTATSDTVTFTLKNSADYLHPCGPNEGITMVCEGPAATCEG